MVETVGLCALCFGSGVVFGAEIMRRWMRAAIQHVIEQIEKESDHG
jgi:hypothetical protein